MVLEYIWSLIAAHLQHHCSKFTALLQHISAPGHFSTITAHFSTFYFIIPYSVSNLGQLCLDFTWDKDNGQLTWISNQPRQLGLTHLKHHCSTFTAPLQHFYCTIAAHLLTAILLNTKFRLSCKERNFYIDVTSLKD